MRIKIGTTALTVSFGITAILYLVSLNFAPYPFQFAIKVLPIIILFTIALQSLTGLLRVLICGGVAASGIGDVFLALDLEHAFLFGLASFLVAHVFYVVSFRYQSDNLSTQAWRIAGALLVVVFGLAMVFHLLPSTGELIIPVSVYLLVISLMGLTAFLYNQNKTTALGACCFICSDAILAQSIFKTPLPFSGVLVMATYYIAQLLIVQGMMLRCISQPQQH